MMALSKNKNIVKRITTLLGDAHAHKPKFKGEPVAFTLRGEKFKHLTLSQTLLVYGMTLCDINALIQTLQHTHTATALLTDVPDIPIATIALRECGLTATPLPF
jgi:hypothetical protein